MGLAASQARFLGITARKSNIEYEGQQVNQQRTALAEEVNALYNKLLALKLPVAPDTTEFYQSNYSFNVSDASTSANGSYIIKSYFLNEDGKTYYVNATRTYDAITAESTNLSALASPWKKRDASTLVDPNGDEYEVKLMGDTEEEQELRKDMIRYINDTIPNKEDKLPDDTNFYTYKVNGQTHYITQNNWEKKPNALISYVQASTQKTEDVSYENAIITFDDNNRMATIKLDESMTTPLEVGTTRTYDTEGYDKALRDYTMSKDEYDKKVADLNAQTESLQQEDKVLELRLNQIDTEQNELQTELEAVKAVLDKNIENTFKTFA